MSSESNSPVPASPWQRRASLAILALAAAYVVTGRLGLLLAIPPGFATAVWPPSGIALAGLLLLGHRRWPGVWLGSFVVNIGTSFAAAGHASAGRAIALAAVIATGASLQALLGAHLVRRWVGFPTRLDREADIGRFLLLGGPVSCLVAASIGVGGLALSSALPLEGVAFSWWTWWVGDTIGVVIFAPLALAWIGSREPIWRGRRTSLTIPLVAAFAVVVILFGRARAWEDARIEQVFRDRTAAIAHRLAKDVDGQVQTLHAIVDLRATLGRLDRQRFHDFVAGPLARHPAVRSLGWSQLVPAEARASFEAARRAEGPVDFEIRERGPDGRMVRAGERPSYVAITYLESLQDSTSILGFDVASEANRREALERTRDTGQPVASARVTILQDPAGESGVLFYLASYRQGAPRDTVAARRAGFEGYAGGVFEIRALLEATLAGADDDHMSLALHDESAPPAERLLFTRALPGDPGTELRADARLDLGGRTWLLRSEASARFLAAHRGWQAWYVLVGGLCFTGLLGGFLLVVTGRAARLELLVEERLAQSESRFRALLESAPDAMVIVRQDGRIGLVNAQAERQFGYHRLELIGQPIEVLVPAGYRDVHPAHRDSYAASPRTRPMASGRELFGLRKDGTEFPAEISLSPIETPEGLLVTAAIRDLTHRQRLEDLRRNSLELEEQNRRIREANRLKNEFLANMSHELRTPLNGIIGFAELIHDGRVGAVTPKQKEYLGDVLASSYHLLQLINEVLDLAKLEAGKMDVRVEPVDLAALVREVTDVVHGLAAKAGVALRVDVPADLGPVESDASKLRQILYNYVSNAIKFTAPGGRVEVVVRAEGDDDLRISVVDTGIGIRAEDLDKLFNEFVQLDTGTAKRYGGTGLGLAVTRRLAAALGGRVGVTSQPGLGSQFFVVLPRHAIGVKA